MTTGRTVPPTLRPWELGRADSWNERGRILGEFEGEQIAILETPSIRWSGTDDAWQKTQRYNATIAANMALAVQAVNAFDALVAACTAVLDEEDRWPGSLPAAVIGQVRAVLWLARDAGNGKGHDPLLRP